MGEASPFCPSPAIANATEDAVGVRITKTPPNAERVYRALRAKQGHPLEDGQRVVLRAFKQRVSIATATLGEE